MSDLADYYAKMYAGAGVQATPTKPAKTKTRKKRSTNKKGAKKTSVGGKTKKKSRLDVALKKLQRFARKVGPVGAKLSSAISPDIDMVFGGGSGRRRKRRRAPTFDIW